MTLLMALSWRFLLILVSERARRLSCGGAPNPAGWANAVKKALRVVQKNVSYPDNVRPRKRNSLSSKKGEHACKTWVLKQATRCHNR